MSNEVHQLPLVADIVNTGSEAYDPGEGHRLAIEAPMVEAQVEDDKPELVELGTDGLRGRWEEIARHATAFGETVVAVTGAKLLLVARDTRLSGEGISEDVMRAAAAMGATVIDLGVLPTPAAMHLAELASEGKLDLTDILAGKDPEEFTDEEILGILRLDATADQMKENAVLTAASITSASHNPPGDNGLKMSGTDGQKINAKQEVAANNYLNDAAARDEKRGEQPGEILRGYEKILQKVYEQALIQETRVKAKEDFPLKGMSIIVDAGFGAAYETAIAVYKGLGAKVVVRLACENRGGEINVEYGATHTDKVRGAVKEYNAEVEQHNAAHEPHEQLALAEGVSHDGDADRALMSSETGREFDGDHMMLLLTMADMRRAFDAGKRGEVFFVVGTTMSNGGIEAALQEAATEFGQEVVFVRADVGDSSVARTMDQIKEVIDGSENMHVNVGGEQSGHTLIEGRTGDGARTATEVMLALKTLNKPRQDGRPFVPYSLDNTIDRIKPYPQLLLKAHLPDNIKSIIASNPEMLKAMEQAEQAAATKDPESGKGKYRLRLNVRPSGTEPCARIMAEINSDGYVKGDPEYAKREAFAESIARALVTRAYEIAGVNDRQDLGYVGSYELASGRDGDIANSIIRQNAAAGIEGGPFADRVSFEDWYSKQGQVVTVQYGDQVLGIAWWDKKTGDMQVRMFRDDPLMSERAFRKFANQEHATIIDKKDRARQQREAAAARAAGSAAMIAA